MPRCAMRYVGMPMVSTPYARMDPVRLPTSPRIDLSVDVRPAPLRPSSVTTSPRFTTMSTPCSTCDSPYQAWRFSMRSTSAMGGGSLAFASHVRLDDLRVPGDLGVAAFGEHGAA